MSYGALLQLGFLGLLAASIPLLWVWVKGDADKYRKLVWITTFVTFDLIIFGAFTRLTDSGLGCPDWPGCYGHSNPVTAGEMIRAAEAAMPSGPVTMVKAWIEMLHRYIAMGVGVLILTLMGLAWARRAELKRSPWPATVLFVLVCVQGAFGAWTVTLKLMPVIVTIHLLLGVLLLCMLGALAAQTNPLPIGANAVARLRGPVFFALAVVFGQIALGGWVSTNYAVLACQDFPLCNGTLVPAMDFSRGFDLTRPLGLNDDGSLLPVQALVAIHWVHRAFALIVIVVLGWLGRVMLAAASDSAYLRNTAWGLFALLGLQVATGVSNVVFAWPLAIAVAHNGGAAAMALLLALLNSHLAAQQRDRPDAFAAGARA